MATYLELVNSVLKRMREAVVGSVTENALSTLVGEFVNDAKREVEDSWNWSSIRYSNAFSTVAGTEQYAMSTAAPALTIRARPFIDSLTGQPQVYLNTVNKESILKIQDGWDPNNVLKRIQTSNQSFRAQPTNFFFINQPPVGSSTGVIIQLVPNPDAVYTITAVWVNPQNDLSASSDVLSIPKDPVIQLAYVYALYERGEELGEALTKAENKAMESLADAVGIDQNLTQTPVIFSNN